MENGKATGAVIKIGSANKTHMKIILKKLKLFKNIFKVLMTKVFTLVYMLSPR